MAEHLLPASGRSSRSDEPGREPSAFDRLARVWREVAVVALVALVTIGGTTLAAHARAEDSGVGIGDGEGSGSIGVAGYVLLVVAVVSVPLRYRWPVVALGGAFGSTMAYVALDYPPGPLWLPLIITFCYVVIRGYRRLAVAALIAGYLASSWLGYLIGRAEAPELAVQVGLAAWLVALLAVAEVVRSRRARAAHERLSAAEAERRRVTEERLRIARELHDVVAHNMSLISIQAGVALHLLDQHPEQARSSLATIKQASKEALVELRSILGVLRQVDEADDEDGTGDPDGSGAPRAPVPGLDRLDALVERAQAAAVHVRVDAEPGATDGLSRAVDLAAYRILQEALTNVARHSYDRTPVVRLRRDGGNLLVEVLDEGVSRPPNEALPGAGHGITGMRERAAAVGGRFEAGPRPGQGFVVRAWLPVDDDDASPEAAPAPVPEDVTP